MATLEEITRITNDVWGTPAQPSRRPAQNSLDGMVGDIFAGVSTQSPLGIAPEKPDRLTFVESAKEIGKGLLRMPERMAAQVGNVMEWVADYRPEKSWLPAQRVIGIIGKKLQPEWHSRMEEANRDIQRKYGEKVSEYWTRAANTGIESKSEKFKKQTWASAFVTKALTGAFESSGSFLAAIGIGYLTKNPQLGILMLSTASGGSAFKAQKEKGTKPEIAQNIGLLTAAWEGLTEQIPFDVILNPTSKSALKRFLKGGTIEGFQEFIQGIGENFFEYFGYNLKDWKSIPDAAKSALPHLMDNWLDNVTAGFLMGGGASAVIRTRANEIVETNPELAEKIASKENPSRTDVEALGIKMNAEERTELSSALKTALEETAEVAGIDEKPPVRPVELEKEQVPVEAPTAPEAVEAKPEAVEAVEGEVEILSRLPDGTKIETVKEPIETRKKGLPFSADRPATEFEIITLAENPTTEQKNDLLDSGWKQYSKEPKRWFNERRETVEPTPKLAKGKKTQAPVVKEVKETQTLEEVKGTGEVKPRGLAKSVEAVAVEKELTKFFEDVPEFKQVKMKEQAKLASDIMNTDYEQAKRIAMGTENAPKGVIPEMVMVAVVNKAVADGDAATLKDISLASGLTGAATTMGQRIRALGELSETSPIKAIQSVVAEREKRYKKGRGKKKLSVTKKETTGKIKESIAKAKPKNGQKALNDFIRSLQC